MTVVTFKVPEALARKLRLAARNQQTSKSALVRRAVETYIDADLPSSARPSAYDLVSEFAGTVQGPRDLSTHRRHMTGYGK